MKYVLFAVAFESVLACLLFGSAGRLDLPWFWALLGVHGVVVAIGAASVDEDLRRERTRRRGGGVDRVFRSLMLLFVVVHLVVAGLDVGRFGWSPRVPAAVHAGALVVYTGGIALALRAMVVNRFFAPVVRLQPERGQRTITSGPYRFVRHPGYAGMLVAVFAECLVFGSLWSVLPAVALAAVVVGRTMMEDRMLRAGLAGYADYAAAVRYRLVPAVW